LTKFAYISLKLTIFTQICLAEGIHNNSQILLKFHSHSLKMHHIHSNRHGISGRGSPSPKAGGGVQEVVAASNSGVGPLSGGNEELVVLVTGSQWWWRPGAGRGTGPSWWGQWGPMATPGHRGAGAGRLVAPASLAARAVGWQGWGWRVVEMVEVINSQESRWTRNGGMREKKRGGRFLNPLMFVGGP
jgi:hypothetical protein